MQKKENKAVRNSSIQVTAEFKDFLEKVKDKNHFDSYESTIKWLLQNNNDGR